MAASLKGLAGNLPNMSMGTQGVAFRNTVYDLVMRRSSTYIGAILIGAMVAENTVDVVVDRVWSMNNKGVRPPPPSPAHPDASLPMS
jgi:hypothetical protein